MIRRHFRTRTSLALALVVGCLAAPTAMAKTDIGPMGATGTGQQPATQFADLRTDAATFDPQPTTTTQFADLRTDAATFDPQPTTTTQFADLRTDAAKDAADTLIRATVSTTPVAVAGPDGFDWGDAGIGAAAILALLIALAGGLVATRRRGRDVQPSGSPLVS